MNFNIYPKFSGSLEGLDKFKKIIDEYHGGEMQFLDTDGITNYVDFKPSVRKAKMNCPSLNEITIHPPLMNYDIEMLFLRDENIVYKEIEDVISLSNELNIDINLLYHTSICKDLFVRCLDEKMKKILDMVSNTRVTILLENVFLITENKMSVMEIAEHYDNEHLKICFDICHAYCKCHIMKKDNIEFFDEYLNKDLLKKYVKQVHFSFTRNNDGYVEIYTHGVKHETMENLIYDLNILDRYGMLGKNIVTEVNEDDRNYVKRKDQLSDIKMLYKYLNREFPA